jgi:hypothetical protein
MYVSVDDKIRRYRVDCDNKPPSGVSFTPVLPRTSGRLHSEFIRLLVTFSTTLKGKVDSTLVKTTLLRVNLNVDGTPITSKTHTHPSHSETSRLLTSSLSSGVPVDRGTHCM